MYGVGTLQGHQADLELDMIDKIVDFLLWVILLLLLVYCLHTVKVAIPCSVCGGFLMEESILCRIAAGSGLEFTHDRCVEFIEYDSSILSRHLKLD